MEKPWDISGRGELLKELEKLSEDEKAYRKYYLSDKTEEDCQELLRQIRPEEAGKRPFTHQDVLAFCFPRLITDAYIGVGADGRRIVLELFPRYKPSAMHSHEACVLSYVLRGTCRHRIGTEDLEMTEGMLCFVAPRVSHALKVYDDSLVINIHIPVRQFYVLFMEQIHQPNPISRFFTAVLLENAGENDYLLFDTGRDLFLREQILEMLKAQNHQDCYCAAELLHMLNLLFIRLLRYYANSSALHKESLTDNQVLDMVFYIHKNLRTITLPALAKRYGYSQTHCSRLLKQNTGRNYVELVRLLRMKQAGLLLENSGLRLFEISDLVGYENPETFIRAFKKEYGMTPGAFRKRREQ